MNNQFIPTDVTKISYEKISGLLQARKINVYHPIQAPQTIMLVNNDIKLEGDNNLWGRVTSLWTMGSFSYTGSNLGYGVSIGRYSSLATGLSIMGAHHFPDWISTSPSFYTNEHHDLIGKDVSNIARSKRRVVIGNDVWIGANVVLKNNITIGDGAIIAANSVVIKDVPPFSIVGGNPAKLIRMRFDEDTIKEIQSLKWWRFHRDDLKGLTANKPNEFLKGLEKRILANEISPYNPKILTLEDFINS
ncbi:CatB-related O-acetyltransferase [Actinobacillus pleuropneumoniae]|uniref:CatB-related O-acetyltransferase n=1 Tax=Actinobacillus pleuropneumoniae TaxID=715 RepID=A0A897PVD6_ACTPL|nr:CatB-related O-acetyltransferase [Actinobacillus pleuropneumoniae]MBT9319597.1 CatB-related O-acetyltransferase [Actinobacillus pleuropneumoniae]MBT9344431.1 CatB-related O-acetyltransferase [Actinobacillus pleuropneumoniae]QSG30240.1 CatB-related O-acetyltransferase [Actinobacillus pleuropneumoniae serovar 19]QSG30253.1 CatB-related O-acetyltransferase [Actinobacillus pleuropneumoniae serovar 19]